MFRTTVADEHLPTLVRRLNAYIGKTVVVDLIDNGKPLTIREVLVAVGYSSVTIEDKDNAKVIIPVIGHKSVVCSVACDGVVIFNNRNAKREAKLTGSEIFYALEDEGFRLRV